MFKTVKQYIEKIWMTILISSILLIFFGMIALVNPAWSMSAIIQIISIVMIAFGVIGISNLIYNIYKKQPFVGSILSSLIFFGVGLFLMLKPDFSVNLILTIVGVVVFMRGIFDIAIGLAVQDENSDKIAWSISGFLGVVAGVLIITKPGLSGDILMMILGAYGVAAGIIGVYYSLHAREVYKEIEKEIKK